MWAFHLVLTSAGLLKVAIEVVAPQTKKPNMEILSMKLRNEYIDLLFTPDVHTLETLVQEQKSAKGDFPSSLPVIFNGDPVHSHEAVNIGASAVVLGTGDAKLVENLDVDIIWSVSSKDQVEVARAADQVKGSKGVTRVLLSESNFDNLVGKLPPHTSVIGVVDAMQQGGQEILQGRRMGTAGCVQILVRRACVGDDEDLPYVKFVQKGLTSKQSNAFAISGLTGSANGHFGTGVSRKPSSVSWRRCRI